LFQPFYDFSRIWNETWLAGFFYKPCNYELFVKQSLNMEMAIIMARVSIISFFLFFSIYSHRNLEFGGELMQMLPPF